MADTLPNVKLPKGGAWVDLYAVTGITVGDRIAVQSLSAASVELSTKATSPQPGVDGNQLLLKGYEAINEQGDSGAWARSVSGGAVNVRLA